MIPYDVVKFDSPYIENEIAMTLDIRGSIKNTKLSQNPYVVFEELISNAIDSYLIRKNDDSLAPGMLIEVVVDFQKTDLLGDHETMSISCRDNGCGFGEAQLQAFLTKDTSYKDDLTISGIGKCKGAGRIQFFHHFSSLAIVSTYRDADAVHKREMSYKEPKKQIDAGDFKTSDGNSAQLGTCFVLDGFKESARGKVMQGEALSSLFSASSLKKQMLITFLQRLVGLESRLGEFGIHFVTRHWIVGEQRASLIHADLPPRYTECKVEIEEREPSSGATLGTCQSFKLSHYKLAMDQYSLPKNAIAFCAKSSPVCDITKRYLRTRHEQHNPVGNFHHIILVESDYLDQQVNEQRDNFDNIPDEFPVADMFLTGKLSYATIYEAIDPIIDEWVAPSSWRKEAVLQEITNEFGISEAMLQDTGTRIVYGDQPQSIAERVLKKYQERVISETAEIFNLKQAILSAEPDSEQFRKQINEIAWKYTSSLKNIDMANLSQLIVRRTAIIQILELACRKQLQNQRPGENVRRKDERIIHSIFFPMRKDSTEVADHDIWLLSEEYYYYDYIASDMPLADIAWDNGEKVFESDIDQSLAEKVAQLALRAAQNSGKRPDIALFSKEGSAIIVEFKAPGVSLDDHVGDLTEYAHLLAAKSGGKLNKFYGYLIGDKVSPLRLQGWTRFATGKGWFQSGKLSDPDTGQPLGEIYFEILYFDDLILRAKKRIGVYQSKLGLNLVNLQDTKK
jgi:hypothetical protein